MAHRYPTRLDSEEGQLVEELLILAQQLICGTQSINLRLWHELMFADGSRQPDLYWLAACASDVPLVHLVADVREQVRGSGFGFWYQPVGVAASVPAWPYSTWLLMSGGDGNRLVGVWGGSMRPAGSEQEAMLTEMEQWVERCGSAYRIADVGIYAPRPCCWCGLEDIVVGGEKRARW